MKKHWPWLLIVVSVVLGAQIVSLWRGRMLSATGFSEEVLQRAAKIEPLDPEPFYKLGLLHQWSLFRFNLQNSARYLEKAIERSPLEQEYWLSLAKVLQKMGQDEDSKRAIENAIRVFPTGYQGRWVAGNLLLQLGELEKALPHFSGILAHYPNQSHLVYDVWEMATDDPDFILEKLVPKDPVSLNQYLRHLYQNGDKAAAVKVWNLKASLGQKVDRDEALSHMEFLLSRGDVREAFQVWRARLTEEGCSSSTDGNGVTNGGFEVEKVLGGGFDWRMANVTGASLAFDRAVTYEGKTSLRISFNGKENVDFHHLYQYVALKPGTPYVLKAHIKTKEVTTRNGVQVEVLGVGPAFRSASGVFTGDNDWTELTVPFHTPTDSQGGIVRVRRERSNKIDCLISGNVWLDNVRLLEDSSGGAKVIR